jgi:3-oxoadipate enol-lactonase
MQFLTTNRLKFYVEQAGSGSHLLVINGTGNDLRRKPSIMDSPLTSHFRVTAYDQRGLGQSDKPEGPYCMQDYADDAAALMDSLEINQAMVLGISFGGMVAQEFAIRHGSRLSRLALWCTSPGGAGGQSYPLQELEDLDLEARVLTGMKLNDTRIDDGWLADNPDAVAAARQRLDMSEFQHETRFAEGRAAQLAARAQHDCYDRLEQISCPVLLGGGRYDGIAKPEAMHALQQKIPDARLKLYDGGHLFMLQDGKAFPDLLAFFNEEDK